MPSFVPGRVVVSSQVVGMKYVFRVSLQRGLRNCQVYARGCVTYRTPGVVKLRLPFTLFEIAPSEKLRELAQLLSRDCVSNPMMRMVSGLLLKVMSKLGRELAQEFKCFFFGIGLSPHVLQLSINNVRSCFGMIPVGTILDILSMIVPLSMMPALTLSGERRELIVFSASAIRSFLRHRLANLIHITGSSSGFKTKVRT